MPRRRARRSPRRKRRSRRGRRARSRSARTSSTASAPRSSRARTSSAASCRARKARRCPRASARPRGRGTSSSSSRAKCCASRATSCRRCGPGIDVEVTREPIGVVGLITPWNFPIAIPAWKIAPALAYGNTVVFKPADLVPGCAWALAEILAKAGIPAGVFNLVMGRGSVVGEVLVNDPDVAAISFTGSVGTGRGIAAKAIARMAKVQLEMGGKNPLVVLDDADLATAVNAATQGAYFSTGPALHGVVAAHRHRRHPRSLRRGDDREAESAQGRRCADRGHGHRSRRRRKPARAGPPVPRDRQGRRGEARLRRRAPEARDRRLSTCRRRCSPTPTTACASRARRSSGRSRA